MNVYEMHTGKLNDMAIRILLADDQPLVRQGLRMYLALDKELEIVGEAGNGYEAVQMATHLVPDIILMDLMMPQMNGVEATEQLRFNGIQAGIIALSQSQDSHLIDAAMKAGADIFISKEIHNDDLITVIKRIVSA